MTQLLHVQSVSGGYNPNKPVIKKVEFGVERGEIVGLIGLNGAGKSTTIKHILGLLEPTDGAITLNGKTIADDLDTYRQAMSFIPETPILYDELTLWEHLRLTAMAYDLTDWEERAESLLKTYRMAKMKHWFPSNFSKGMRQKVMIMCAFLVKPELYVVDEPFLGLDPVGIQSLLDQMVEMKNSGAGILMSTHILTTAEKYCDRFVLLHHGTVYLKGTLAELRTQANMPNAGLDEIYVEMTKEDDR
ncbi:MULTISPECIES: ABC transporter ATP-binding protein [unclassified Geomicrobium]|uniref:ABC transporter ATP-binding protein n=1 Tax=unclassified Geomicrobium TaxID=2628951 RepID=UPI00045ED946|nr:MULTISPECIES: ABC transporter ATP-binding protein [unclassified Geomicrobium]GAJ98985.1 ABC transporter, ATP-binding protein EcsA [Geomicrobium sp. JCM 19055]GAK06320.1 ABC transporter, ATP-binding protein EcsA [Geomicrobium sp. JCM 19038]